MKALTVWQPWASLLVLPLGHDERDLAAVLAGAYGECPLGRCGLAVRARKMGLTLEQMVEIRRRELRKRPSREKETASDQEVLAL